MPGLPEIEVAGCAEGCEHVWNDGPEIKYSGGTSHALTGQHKDSHTHFSGTHGQYCQRCGGWRGSYGLERTIEEYVGHTVAICRELKRVLREDGVMFWNCGDSYAGSWGNYGTRDGKQRSRISERWHRQAYEDADNGWRGLPPTANPGPGLKPKDLCGIPWRCALALQADGWWLRSAPPWIKKNCMPESMNDRPTTAHEYWFMLTKSERYYWDKEAVSVPGSATSHGGNGANAGEKRRTLQDGENGTLGQTVHQVGAPGRNLRTSDFFYDSLDALIGQQRAYLAHLEHLRDNGGLLLDEDSDPLALLVNTKGYPGAHYATFNEDLIRPLILGSTSARGCCSVCGAPWERVIEKTTIRQGSTYCSLQDTEQPPNIRHGKGASTIRSDITSTTTGWRPTCSHDAPTVPCTVLDPFSGSGTVGLVAVQHKRRVLLIELSKTYCDEHIIPRLEAPIQVRLL